MEMEVCWDGSHQGSDQDLLCCPGVPVKRQGQLEPRIVVFDGISRPAVAHREAYCGAIAEAVLACVAHGGLTQAQLSRVTGYSSRQIANAVGRLIVAERLVVCGHGEKGPLGPPPRMYRATDGGAA
jgi:hypothetical protein